MDWICKTNSATTFLHSPYFFHSCTNFKSRLLNVALCYFFLPIYFHRTAEVFKEQGNAFYVKKDYAEAFNYYTKAIGTYLPPKIHHSLFQFYGMMLIFMFR